MSSVGFKRNKIRRRLSNKSSNAPKKRMIIKPFKNKPKLPESFEAETFAKLYDAVNAIHQKQHAVHSQEELYRSVESLCIHKKGEAVYKRLYDQCEKHIASCVQSVRAYLDSPLELVNYMERKWQDHSDQMLTIRCVFLRLDRSYVAQIASNNPNHPKSLWDMGLKLFRHHLLQSQDVIDKLVSSLIELITKERNGEVINRSLLKNLIHMLNVLDIYHTHFEFPFLSNTNNYYQIEGARLVQELNVSDYLNHINSRLQQEMRRVVAYLDQSTRPFLVEKLENNLIKEHVERIIADGFDQLMSNNRKNELGLMYYLVSRVQALSDLCRVFKIYVENTGSKIVNDQEDEKRMIPRLLELKENIDIMVDEAFNSNKDFKFALTEAFELVINLRENKPAELIARYVDLKLRTGNKGLTQDDMEILLDKIMILFRYVHAKDVFQAFYKKQLSKRLLLNKSSSQDLEQFMFSKLKEECGASYTNKFEVMFQDMIASREHLDGYKKNLKSSNSNVLDIDVKVLTQGIWPEFIHTELKLPKIVEDVLENFRRFYEEFKHNGRKITWNHALSTAVLKARFPKGRKELAVSAQQAAVLYLFNDKTIWSFVEIQQTLNINEDDLRRVLASLAHNSKARILLQNPKNRQIAVTDRFKVNMEFKSRLVRLTLSQLQMRETKAEQKQTSERVLADRAYAIDATIVRIMKSRKTLSHAQLMAETFQQLKFPTTPGDIKKRIGNLIEREYLERDEDDSTIYNYLA